MSLFAKLICLTAALATVSAAHARNKSEPAKTCQSAMVTLPDPFDVDPKNTVAIKAFIGSVVRLPPHDEPDGFRRVFTECWRRYQPDRDPAEISARVAKAHFSSSAMELTTKVLRGQVFPDAGRLRYAWSLFLKDIAPDYPDANLETPSKENHLALALEVPIDARSIITFLSELYSDAPRAAKNRAHVLFDRLYEDYLPGLEFHPSLSADDHLIFRKVTDPAREMRVVTAWIAYLQTLTGSNREFKPTPLPFKSTKAASSQAPFSPQFISAIPIQVEDVDPKDFKSIIAFLANRYRLVAYRTRGAIKYYFAEFSRELNLPDFDDRCSEGAITNALYQKRRHSADEITDAWARLLAQVPRQ